jgi:DMSO/TMAO reductase YedYZ molybdopterin-dependent catalytic subunit
MMHTRRYWLLAVLAAGLLPAQDSPPAIRVTGAVKQPLTLTASDLAKMPRASVRVSSHGAESVYGGVFLHQVLKKAGVPQGSELRGKLLASYVLAEAQDGYRVVFSLAELDPSFLDSEILLADTADGKPLPATQGPFKLVVPRDKHGARSVRMLTRLDVVQVGK